MLRGLYKGGLLGDLSEHEEKKCPFFFRSLVFVPSERRAWWDCQCPLED